MGHHTLPDTPSSPARPGWAEIFGLYSHPDGMDDWAGHRRYLFAVAYRLLGSALDAGDAVQEAFIRLRTSVPADLEHPGRG
ncbi:sigma factor [Sphaerisporangium sp. NPDC088356]|uniref:sigma factor n=1 Tax=Sphaerisporangium sp. NPDC088356 TaxID=3154871 RepID=UPI00341B1E58